MVRNDGVATALLEHARYEIMPTAAIEEKVVASVPRSVTITITASPTKGLDASLDLTERLRAEGYRVVPRLSARLVGDRAHLDDIVARLVACGVDDVFVPAGDADPPLGRDRAEQPGELAALSRVKPGGWLVEEHDRRVCGESPRDSQQPPPPVV